MPIPAWLGAGALTLAGTLATNASNAAQARNQMRFQERMSGSAHQRGRADLEAAGYNPMLGVGGVGASSPVGAQARMENAVGHGVNSAMTARMNQAQLKLLEAQVQKEYSQAQLNHAHNTQVTTLTTPEVNLLNARKELTDADTATKKKLLAFVGQLASSEIESHLASALASRTHAGEMTARTILLRLQQREAENMSEAQKSWWMTNVAPYLNSGKTAAGMAANLVAPLAVGRGVRALSGGLKALRPDPFGKKAGNLWGYTKADVPGSRAHLYPD